MSAGHHHSHSHSHSHVPAGDAPHLVGRMLISAAILAGFFAVELTAALLFNSMTLLADAGHMLTDVVAVFMGLTAVVLARRGSSSPDRTFGWHRAEVFTAVGNAMLLIAVAALILRESIERLGDAPEVPGVPLIVLALTGLAVNVAVALLLRSHSDQSLAVKGAYTEVIADTVGSIGVLVAGLVTVLTDWPYADIVVSVLIALWVTPRAIALAGVALRILSQSSPRHINVQELHAALSAVDSVTDVHHIHAWTLAPGKDIVTAHLISQGDVARVLGDARAVLAARGLEHSTVQIEPPGAATNCAACF